jgi:hypothetical protein
MHFFMQQKFVLPILFGLTLLFNQCSLITIESKDDPLSTRELNARILTHEFGTEFFNMVDAATDSIITQSDDGLIQLNALRWKINAVSACQNANFHASPMYALIDTWVFTAQMNEFFKTGHGRTLFEEFQPEVLATSEELASAIRDITQSVSSRRDFTRHQQFVQEYVRSNPFETIDFSRESIKPEWQEFWGIDDSTAVESVGTLAQVVSDLTSRTTSFTEQVPSQAGWKAELMFRQTGMSTDEIIDTMDSLAQLIDKMAFVVENGPVLLDTTMIRMRQEMIPLIRAIDKKWTETLFIFSKERLEITKALQVERAAIMKDLDTTTQALADRAFEYLKVVIKQVLIFAIIIIIVILGLPFLMGYLVGKYIRKK